MNGVSLSVIVPTFNRPSLLREAVQSLLRQTRPPDEIIVVDDASAEEFRAAIGEIAMLDRSILLCRLPRNAGTAAARNHGLARARGQWVLFLDDDDLLLPRALEAHLRVLADRPLSDVLVCRSRMFLGDPPAGCRRPRVKFWLVDQFSGRRLERDPFRELLRFPVPLNAVLARRSRLGDAPFPAGLRMHEDHLLWLVLARAGCRFAFHAEPYSLVRAHGRNSQAGPLYASESPAHLERLMAAGLPRDRHDRFLCRARLFRFTCRQGGRIPWRHLRASLRSPDLFAFYLAWFAILQVKKVVGRRRLERSPRPESGPRPPS